MTKILEGIVNGINGFLWGQNILVYLLIGAAVFFTYRTKFIQFRFIRHLKSVFQQDESHKGDGKVTPFQSFCLGTACRVGAGNVVGVIAAVSVGGPGAIFWMWLVAFLGSSTAFVEAVLAVIHRETKSDGSYVGGAPWFMTKLSKNRIFGALFVLSSIICYIGATQVMSNTITESLKVGFSMDKIVVAIVLTVLTAVLIIGKRDRIIGFLNKLVPIMAVLYLAVATYIILKNIAVVPSVIKTIVTSAFGLNEVVGGTIGGALMMGIKRGLFSNEAGTGNATYAAAVADTKHPVEQGIVQMLGVFLDTLVICTATALIILIPQNVGGDGVELFQNAVVSQIGNIGKPFVTAVIFLFSFSTILGVVYYGKTALSFFTKNTKVLLAYNLLMVAMVYIGAVAENHFVWSLADLGLGLMTVLNLLCIVPLGSEAIESLNEYEELSQRVTITEKN